MSQPTVTLKFFEGLKIVGPDWVATIVEDFRSHWVRIENGDVLLSSIACSGDKSLKFDLPAKVRGGTLTLCAPPEHVIEFLNLGDDS